MSKTTLTDIGEAGIIRYLRHQFDTQLIEGLGIGDDGAVVPHATPLVAVADAMMEEVHFSRAFSSAHDVGEKLVAVNVSDIAAMGARATTALFTFSAPNSLEWSWAKGLIDGVSHGAARYGLQVVGGDVTSSRGPIALSLTVLGALIGPSPLRRDAAKAGDRLYVTGTLGAAALGLQALRTGSPTPDNVPLSVQAQRVPTARVDESVRLALWTGCSCAMDISDGLLLDAPRMAAASMVDLHIEVGRLPVSPEVAGFTDARERYALVGGEDYELLFTARTTPPFPATEIGMVVEGSGQVIYTRAGELYAPGFEGYSHF